MSVLHSLFHLAVWSHDTHSQRTNLSSTSAEMTKYSLHQWPRISPSLLKYSCGPSHQSAGAILKPGIYTAPE